jgi:predicted nuclease of predicted toxin-antitoxin system
MRIVITKDEDFYYSFIQRRVPYKLVLVKLGNMRLATLRSYFDRNAMRIIEEMQNNSIIILELEEIIVREITP